MLRVQSVSKSYGADTVLRDVSFVLNPGQRAGLVGPNGSGKSTLLRIIAAEIPPDEGSVWTAPRLSVGYLPQYLLDELDLSVRESLLRGAGEVGVLPERIQSLEQALAEAASDDVEPLLAEYAEQRERFERLGGYALEARMEEVIAGLGLTVEELDAPVRALSGGNKTKLSLARLLLSGADILLLDEPTNYLDLAALLWLERFVLTGSRSYLIVSHDRRFLDRTVDTILELDAREHTLRVWAGNYTAYAEARQRDEEKQLETYLDQQAKIRRIEEDIRRTKEHARSIENRFKSGPGADVARGTAKKIARKAKARERRLERQLESDEMVEKPRASWGVHLADLGRDPIDDDRVIVQTERLHAGYDGHEVLHGVDFLLRGRDRVALLGENGSGKSTLIRCLAGDLSYEGQVRIGPSVRLGLLSQEAENLPLDRTVLEVFRSHAEMYEDEARTYLHKFLFSGQEVLKPVGSLSYGQRAKLALALLILSDANFLVLDEPTSHLDIPALETVEGALGDFVGPLLVVSHDRYFLDSIDINRVEAVESGQLRALESVEQYEAGLAAGRPVC
jgi:ATP-binding cassette subfamily F protein 3